MDSKKKSVKLYMPQTSFNINIYLIFCWFLHLIQASEKHLHSYGMQLIKKKKVIMGTTKEHSPDILTSVVLTLDSSEIWKTQDYTSLPLADILWKISFLSFACKEIGRLICIHILMKNSEFMKVHCTKV